MSLLLCDRIREALAQDDLFVESWGTSDRVGKSSSLFTPLSAENKLIEHRFVVALAGVVGGCFALVAKLGWIGSGF
jgi:hypothetical protein